MSLGGAGASSSRGVTPSRNSSPNRSASLMNELGALVWNGVLKPKDGPFGQLGNAHVIPFAEIDSRRDE
jgi:hypothetical protein